MKFDLTKSNGVYGLWFMGFSVPLWIAFAILNLTNGDPTISMIVAIIGGGAFIAGVVMMMQNLKESEGSNCPTSDVAKTLYLLSLGINIICIILGNIAML
ncbi:MAG: hypothetical protein ACTSPV_15980 [Candidatus Hodarchaeales archaeon]